MKSNVKNIDITEGRLFFVSDVHGELPTLRAALVAVDFDYTKDHLVCAGDLVDRGTDSKGTAKFFLDDTTGHIHTVMGNHDAFALDALTDQNRWIRVANGGQWLEEETTEYREELSTTLRSLPYAIRITYEGMTFGVSHACVPDNDWDKFTVGLDNPKVSEQYKHECTWNRSLSQKYRESGVMTKVSGVDFSIHGHCVVSLVTKVSNSLFIDTGACFSDGKLSLVEVGISSFHTTTYSKVL